MNEPDEKHEGSVCMWCGGTGYAEGGEVELPEAEATADAIPTQIPHPSFAAALAAIKGGR